MGRKSVHTPVVSREELRRIVPPEKLGPNSPLLEKTRKKREHPEHDAQVRMYELLAAEAETARGRDCCLPSILPIIHAIPQFVGADESWRSKKHGARYRAEGQRPGIPDNHVPVSNIQFHVAPIIFSLYVELKYEGYPSADQRRVFPLLAENGNAVVVIRCPDVEELARRGCETILRYLEPEYEAHRNFPEFSHPKFTYLP